MRSFNKTEIFLYKKNEAKLLNESMINKLLIYEKVKDEKSANDVEPFFEIPNKF